MKSWILIIEYLWCLTTNITLNKASSSNILTPVVAPPDPTTHPPPPSTTTPHKGNYFNLTIS